MNDEAGTPPAPPQPPADTPPEIGDDERVLRWCAKHSEPAWLYLDGSLSCRYDLVVETTHDDHVLIALSNAPLAVDASPADPPPADDEVAEQSLFIKAIRSALDCDEFRAATVATKLYRRGFVGRQTRRLSPLRAVAAGRAGSVTGALADEIDDPPMPYNAAHLYELANAIESDLPLGWNRTVSMLRESASEIEQLRAAAALRREA